MTGTISVSFEQGQDWSARAMNHAFQIHEFLCSPFFDRSVEVLLYVVLDALSPPSNSLAIHAAQIYYKKRM